MFVCVLCNAVDAKEKLFIVFLCVTPRDAHVPHSNLFTGFTVLNMFTASDWNLCTRHRRFFFHRTVNHVTAHENTVGTEFDIDFEWHLVDANDDETIKFIENSYFFAKIIYWNTSTVHIRQYYLRSDIRISNMYINTVNGSIHLCLNEVRAVREEDEKRKIKLNILFKQ